MATKKKYKDFETAIERLEEITQLMESGEISLEESIGLYTEGLEIARFCDQKLSETETKIKVIQEKGGLLTEDEQPLPVGSDDEDEA